MWELEVFYLFKPFRGRRVGSTEYKVRLNKNLKTATPFLLKQINTSI